MYLKQNMFIILSRCLTIVQHSQYIVISLIVSLYKSGISSLDLRNLVMSHTVAVFDDMLIFIVFFIQGEMVKRSKITFCREMWV